MALSARIKLSDWKNLIDVDFPPMRFTEATRQETVRAAQSGRYSPADVRIATGSFYTDAEYEAMRSRELARPLP
ncbi:MAG TPA: hypothetical protein VHA12_03860 [Candidatus Nanoarchaeia archaeon]|nr:hypothetical protein [Candidatus Nanoarchaeia archaeon]